MVTSEFILFTAALLSSVVAALTILRDPRSFPARVFAVGIALFAIEAGLVGLSVQSATYAEVRFWQRLRFLAAVPLPGCWLMFSLSFGRENYQEFLKQWRWVIFAVFLVPLGLVAFFHDAFFVDVARVEVSSRWVLGVSRAGYVYVLLALVINVIILMNLERTLQAFAGLMRWRIKLVVLGLGSVFLSRVYTGSQTLLFSELNSNLESINGGALIVAGALLLWAWTRLRVMNENLYLSSTALYYSLTVIMVGVYLLAVGVLAQVVREVGGASFLPFEAVLIFMALLLLAFLLLSDEWQQRSRMFIVHHFRRPRYDYRREWTRFTQGTTSLLEIKDLCAAVATRVSETFGVGCATIWLLDETQLRLLLGASTAFSEKNSHLQICGEKGEELIRRLQGVIFPVDFDPQRADWAGEFSHEYTNVLQEARLRYCAPLVSNRELLGLLSLDERPTREPFSLEDLELLKVIADQAAAGLLNLRLSQRLVKAKEIEAFQTLSTFFIHDLKNLASTLSLTMQNLPVHFDDPDFRQDATRVMTSSVEKINSLCGRLSLLAKGLDLKTTPTDLNGVVTATLADLNGLIRTTIVQDLHPLPKINVDAEQVEKVLVNLLLNAHEALGAHGAIWVSTEQRSGWAVLTVKDNGLGMSEEFLTHSLFQPFHTTKSKGLGIGLFHSKKIVEAHHGRIEVESEQGKGSIVRVFLPTGY